MAYDNFDSNMIHGESVLLSHDKFISKVKNKKVGSHKNEKKLSDRSSLSDVTLASGCSFLKKCFNPQLFSEILCFKDNQYPIYESRNSNKCSTIRKDSTNPLDGCIPNSVFSKRSTHIPNELVHHYDCNDAKYCRLSSNKSISTANSNRLFSNQLKFKEKRYTQIYIDLKESIMKVIPILANLQEQKEYLIKGILDLFLMYARIRETDNEFYQKFADLLHHESSEINNTYMILNTIIPLYMCSLETPDTFPIKETSSSPSQNTWHQNNYNKNRNNYQNESDHALILNEVNVRSTEDIFQYPNNENLQKLVIHSPRSQSDAHSESIISKENLDANFITNDQSISPKRIKENKKISKLYNLESENNGIIKHLDTHFPYKITPPSLTLYSDSKSQIESEYDSLFMPELGSVTDENVIKQYNENILGGKTWTPKKSYPASQEYESDLKTPLVGTSLYDSQNDTMTDLEFKLSKETIFQKEYHSRYRNVLYSNGRDSHGKQNDQRVHEMSSKIEKEINMNTTNEPKHENPVYKRMILDIFQSFLKTELVNDNQEDEDMQFKDSSGNEHLSYWSETHNNLPTSVPPNETLEFMTNIYSVEDKDVNITFNKSDLIEYNTSRISDDIQNPNDLKDQENTTNSTYTFPNIKEQQNKHILSCENENNSKFQIKCDIHNYQVKNKDIPLRSKPYDVTAAQNLYHNKQLLTNNCNVLIEDYRRNSSISHSSNKQNDKNEVSLIRIKTNNVPNNIYDLSKLAKNSFSSQTYSDLDNRRKPSSKHIRAVHHPLRPNNVNYHDRTSNSLNFYQVISEEKRMNDKFNLAFKQDRKLNEIYSTEINQFDSNSISELSSYSDSESISIINTSFDRNQKRIRPSCIPLLNNIESLGSSGWLTGEKTSGEYIPQKIYKI